MNRYVVSIYAVSHVPRAQTLEHFFVVAPDGAGAEHLACQIFASTPHYARYVVAAVRTSALPPTTEYARPPPKGRAVEKTG